MVVEGETSTFSEEFKPMGHKNDGGHFFEGVPRHCFESGNPCSKTNRCSGDGVAGEQTKPAQTATTFVRSPAVSRCTEDDSHLSDFSRISQSVAPSDQFLSGGVLLIR